MLVDEADVDQAALAQESYKEAIGEQLMDLVFVLTCMFVWVPEVALNLGHHGAHSCKERRQGHLVPIPRIDWLARLRKDQKVLSYLVKLFQVVLDLDIDAFRVDVVSFEEKLDWVDGGGRGFDCRRNLLLLLQLYRFLTIRRLLLLLLFGSGRCSSWKS